MLLRMKVNLRKESSVINKNYKCKNESKSTVKYNRKRAKRALLNTCNSQYIFFVQPEVRVQRVLEVSKILYHFLPPIGRFYVPQNPMTPNRRLQAQSE